jgi:hypothetical protein
MELAMYTLPAIAFITYLFAFAHYKFRSQLIFFVLIAAFTAQLLLVKTPGGRICACIGLGFVSVVNIFRFTAPQV